MQLIAKNLLTPKMVKLILNEHYHIFFKEPNSPMETAILHNRTQFMKISLNPMLNNLNYATNIPELYEAILTAWTHLIKN